MLKLAIPKGSLEERTFWIFEEAGLKILRNSERSYAFLVNDPRISEVMMLRPQEIPEYVESGDFDIGITGYDWIMERGAEIVQVADLAYSKQSWNKVKIVLATCENNLIKKPENIPSGARVFTEYPKLTASYFRLIGKKMDIKLSYGATEGKVPRLASYLVDITETGKTLKANGKKIISVILESTTLLIANRKFWKDPVKKQAMEEIADLLLRIVRAQNKMLIKFNVSARDLQKIVAYVPAADEPTIAKLSSNDKYAVETVVPKDRLAEIITQIRTMGARDILELEIKGLAP